MRLRTLTVSAFSAIEPVLLSAVAHAYGSHEAAARDTPTYGMARSARSRTA